MRWFNESYVRHTQKSGMVSVTRSFGKWTVNIGAFEYTSPYVSDMWRQAIETFIPREQRGRVRTVLMLGLAAGGEIKTFHLFFPGCEVVAVEYDPDMVTLARELKLHKPFPFPRVLIEDAATAVPALAGQTFDLIVVDMFQGPEPSALSQDEKFLQSLDAILAQDGHILVNIFRENESYLDAMSKVFVRKQFWTNGRNLLGYFTKQ